MPPRKRSKKKDKDSSNKGSRQKDRDDEPVKFVSTCEPTFVDRPGSANFFQIDRKEVVGKDSGKVKTEFTQLTPGFYNDDNEPRFNKKCPECEKGGGITWAPTMTGEMISALENTMTEEEWEEFEAEQEEDDD